MSEVIDERARVVSNVQASQRLFILELDCPCIARMLRPGQFVHIQLPGMPDKILRRPFSVYKADAETGCFSIMYQVVGEGTDHMTRLLPGEELSVLGPIGTTWQPPASASVLLVAGGVGAAPLFMLAQALSTAGRQFKVVLGAQTKDALIAYEDYCALAGASVEAATDDGSFGFAGFCTMPAQEAIASGDYDYVAVCGPEPVIKIVAGFALDAGISCEVSLERRMACGVGACLSCVVDTTDGKKRCCVDGPVFSASKVVW